jgi:hypothetical protein
MAQKSKCFLKQQMGKNVSFLKQWMAKKFSFSKLIGGAKLNNYC